MSQVVTAEGVLVIAANFLFYFIVGISGAFTKDLYDNFVNGKKKIEIVRIFIAAFTTAFLAIGLQDYTSSRFTLNVIILSSFLCGVVGFELFGCINSIKNLKITILEVIQLKKFMDSGVSLDEIQKTLATEVNEKHQEENINTTGITQTTQDMTESVKRASHDETHEESLLETIISENSE